MKNEIKPIDILKDKIRESLKLLPNIKELFEIEGLESITIPDIEINIGDNSSINLKIDAFANHASYGNILELIKQKCKLNGISSEGEGLGGGPNKFKYINYMYQDEGGHNTYNIKLHVGNPDDPNRPKE